MIEFYIDSKVVDSHTFLDTLIDGCKNDAETIYNIVLDIILHGAIKTIDNKTFRVKNLD